MIFLTPAALWLLLAGGAVVALYMLRIKRRRQTVPSLEFWRTLAGQQQTRSLMQRLKRWLSLLLWLFILILLVFGVANPAFTFGSIKARSIAVIIDNSASMQAAEDGGTRLELAGEAVRRLARGRPVRDEWLLIEAGGALRVAQSWTSRDDEVIEAAGGLEPHLGESDLHEALGFAEQLLEGRRRPTIVLVTDRQPGEFVGSTPSDRDIFIEPVGTRRDNVGITRLRVRPNHQQASQHVFIRVDNAADEPVQVDLVVEVDEVMTSVEPLELDAGGHWSRTFVLERPDGGVLRTYLETDDALAADNEAFAILPPIRSARVLLVSDEIGAYFFEHALGAMAPLVDVSGSSTLDASVALQPVKGAHDLVILNAVASFPDAIDAPVVALHDLPPWVGARVVGELDDPVLEVRDSDHPLMRFLELGSGHVARAQRVELTRPADVLVASSEGDPLIFLSRDTGTDVLCVAFDVLETDLPFRNSFPVLLRNAVGYLVQQGAAWTVDQVRVGEPIVSRRPVPDVAVSAITRTDGTEFRHDLDIHDGQFRFVETARPGPVRLEIGDDVAYAAINVASIQETRLAPPVAAKEAGLPASSTLVHAPPWVMFAALALGLILFEWMSYHMRWTE